MPFDYALPHIPPQRAPQPMRSQAALRRPPAAAPIGQDALPAMWRQQRVERDVERRGLDETQRAEARRAKLLVELKERGATMRRLEHVLQGRSASSHEPGGAASQQAPGPAPRQASQARSWWRA